MNRRAFTQLMGSTMVSLAGAWCFPALADENQHYLPTWESLNQHKLPEWFQDAKLGIFIHLGLYSVPAWAKPTGELGTIDWKVWFINNPYAEWYLNSLRIPNSPTAHYHQAAYGTDFDYYRFSERFNEGIEYWDPHQWAKLFHKVGARYVVITTKHHDGFRLWPSSVQNPHADGRNLSAKRDIVGDITAAVRASGMKMGFYYSGGLDWTFTQKPIMSREDLMERVPQSEEYARYADAQWRELIHRYQPSVLWNDISYPKVGEIPQIFAEYYNTVPDGVINNRFGVEYKDYTTPEYAKYDKITEKKWESCRGLEGAEQVIAPDKLIALLVDIVSKNGNLLLNIGPRSDGSISAIQLDRLHKLGTWLDINGEGLFGSRTWVRPYATNADGTDVRFTKKDGSLYVFFLNRPEGDTLRIPGVRAKEGTQVQVLGLRAGNSYKQRDNDVLVMLEEQPQTRGALAVRMTPEPEALS